MSHTRDHDFLFDFIIFDQRLRSLMGWDRIIRRRSDSRVKIIKPATEYFIYMLPSNLIYVTHHKSFERDLAEGVFCTRTNMYYN